MCVGGGEIERRRGGAGTGRTKRVDEHKGLSLDLEPVPGPFPFLVSFPFLSFASLRQWSEREINNLCTLSAAWGVAISSQGKPATLPVLARPTTPPQEMFPGWWQCGQGRDWLSEWGNRQLALADWEIFPAERAAIWPLWLPWFILQGTNVHCHLATTPSLPPSFSLAFVSVLTELPTWTWKSFPALPSHPLTPRYLRSYKKLNLHLKRAVWLQCPACQLPFLVRMGKQSPGTRASNLFLPRFIEKACLCSKLASN